MTVAALVAAQIALHAQIEARAVALGYDAAKVAPIYDGVVDAGAYLAARPRVMWILKEPYDDFDAEGNPQGGGWTMFKDFKGGIAKASNGSKALRNITYASYAILNGAHAWAELPSIANKPDEYGKALESIAYCNIGKMPGRTTTSTVHLRKICEEWKDLLFRQIDLYAPDVIIVCGTDTMQSLAPDMMLNLSKPIRTIKRGKAVVDVHAWSGKRLLWAPHPAARIIPGEWVDAVIAAVGGNE